MPKPHAHFQTIYKTPAKFKKKEIDLKLYTKYTITVYEMPKNDLVYNLTIMPKPHAYEGRPLNSGSNAPPYHMAVRNSWN